MTLLRFSLSPDRFSLFETMLIGNLRLSGLILRQTPAAHVADDLAPWGWAGLSAQFLKGSLLLAAEAAKLCSSGPFRTKIELLLAALLFQFVVHRRVIRSSADDLNPFGAKVLASILLTLWVGVIVAGLATVLFD